MFTTNQVCAAPVKVCVERVGKGKAQAVVVNSGNANAFTGVKGDGRVRAQIAAHLVNCQIPVVLFDLPAKEGPKNGIVSKAIANLKKLKPAPLGNADDADLIVQANYEENMGLLGQCDLIIEAIAERMDWKHDLYKKVAPHINANALFATNTSGLSIAKLSEGFDAELKSRFCGVHFFNPPVTCTCANSFH